MSREVNARALTRAEELMAIERMVKRAAHYRSAAFEALPENDMYDWLLNAAITEEISDLTIGRAVRAMIIEYLRECAEVHGDSLEDFARG